MIAPHALLCSGPIVFLGAALFGAALILRAVLLFLATLLLSAALLLRPPLLLGTGSVSRTCCVPPGRGSSPLALRLGF